MRLLARYLAIMAMLACGVPAAAEEIKIVVAFDAPASNYQVQIQEVYRVDSELWAISRISTFEDIGDTAITRVSDAATIEAEKLPVVHKVLGKSWNWGKDTDSLRYVNEADLKEQLTNKMAKSVWKREQRRSGANFSEILRRLLN